MMHVQLLPALDVDIGEVHDDNREHGSNREVVLKSCCKKVDARAVGDCAREPLLKVLQQKTEEH